MYEHRRQPLASHRVYVRRIARSVLVATVITLLSLVVGVAGYSLFGGLALVESFEQASMILSGMGPTATMTSSSGKIFSGLYALYSGLMLLVTMGVMTAPIIHRFFHKLHLDVSDRQK